MFLSADAVYSLQQAVSIVLHLKVQRRRLFSPNIGDICLLKRQRKDCLFVKKKPEPKFVAQINYIFLSPL